MAYVNNFNTAMDDCQAPHGGSGLALNPLSLPVLCVCYFLAGAAGCAGAVTAGLAAGAGAFAGLVKL